MHKLSRYYLKSNIRKKKDRNQAYFSFTPFVLDIYDIHEIVGVAGNMKSRTSINESWVPALQHVAGSESLLLKACRAFPTQRHGKERKQLC